MVGDLLTTAQLVSGIHRDARRTAVFGSDSGAAVAFLGVGEESRMGRLPPKQVVDSPPEPGGDSHLVAYEGERLADEFLVTQEPYARRCR